LNETLVEKALFVTKVLVGIALLSLAIWGVGWIFYAVSLWWVPNYGLILTVVIGTADIAVLGLVLRAKHGHFSTQLPEETTTTPSKETQTTTIPTTVHTPTLLKYTLYFSTIENAIRFTTLLNSMNIKSSLEIKDRLKLTFTSSELKNIKQLAEQFNMISHFHES
jgi:hypothetical protein